ncbi:relaxase/mobilization nuclease domain-containing protein [Gordonibacter urolithinfaciens]|uniref:relaxase/mobilization nuclease domain-containing protein n=2 Tax=Eggerthellaceae TaxID=1643826 RepID=UPI0001FD70B1|nr:relaxase/mobilization nuclease domain-containing protein [Gordonibacter urolithinfaciens]EGC88137.1 relaxase/mobilization nuclease domain protein [Eggerthella sp. HGA1]MCB7087240.1 relaxase/mobilization nuclease domain-containing protein [Gordonibacter urolithinfaciens]
MLKTITGHTGCAGAMDYLREGSKQDRRKRRMGEISEADALRLAAKANGIAGYLHEGHKAEFDRALAEDFVGVPPSARGNWARYMDDLRKAAGCDRRTGGREGKAVTYRHYVLAPDPEDGIDLATLRAYAKEWVVKAFGPGATAAIVYHDDNHERLKKGLQGIPHAHICVNALNTETGRKWHFTNADLARQANVAQELAEKYSLAPLPRMRASDAKEDALKTMRICRTKEECAMLAKGFVPYKEAIRRAVAKSCRTARSWEQFEAALADKGISVAITKRGTLTYRDSNGRRAKEQKLGLNFGIVAVGEAIKRNSAGSASLPDVDAAPAAYDVSLVKRRGKVECRLGTERLVWHEQAESRWQHLDNIKSLERAAKVKASHGIVDGESYADALSSLNLQLEKAAESQDPAAAQIRCEIKSVMFAQTVVDLAVTRKRAGDEPCLEYSEALLRKGRQLGVANIESIAAIARRNGIDRPEGWDAAVLAAERNMSARERDLQDALVEGSWARDAARLSESVEAMRSIVGGKSEAAWTYDDASAVQAGISAEKALEGVAESRGESVASVLARAEGMVRAIESAEAAYFDAARDVSRIAGARDAAYKVEGLEAPPSALAVGRAGEPKPQARDAGERRSHLAAEIHAKHIEAARKKAVSKSAAASRAKQAAYQSAKSRSIAANVAAKEGRASSR